MKKNKIKSQVIELKDISYLNRLDELGYDFGDGFVAVEVLNDCVADGNGIIRPTVRPKSILMEAA